MRYYLATILVCTLAVPASALPTVSPNSISALKADPMVHAVKSNRPQSHRHSRKDDGIHPLVGSGDY